MKVIIAGGRDFNDYDLLRGKCDEVIGDNTDIEIISGTANGADRLGERYAKEKGYPVVRFPAKWSEYGKSAGPIRNKEMADYGDTLISFWDGKSKGTKHMIETAKRNNLHVTVVLW